MRLPKCPKHLLPQHLEANKRVRRLQTRFRILQGWTIDADVHSEYKGQSCIGDRKRATIYMWPVGKKEPTDFLFHEMLHVALKALRLTPAPKQREAEEGLVRDISRIFRTSLRPDFKY